MIPRYMKSLQDFSDLRETVCVLAAEIVIILIISTLGPGDHRQWVT